MTTKDKPFQQGNLYAWFVVFVLCLTSIFAYLDRQIINLLVEPIKLTLGINDTQIGLLQGVSFALLYVIAAIPIAWAADFGNRTRIISIGIICWALATFSCGLATTFMFMFITRTIVGLGEATLTPSGYSLIGDYFQTEKVGLAISFFTGSGFLGAGLAYIIGGQIIGILSQSDFYTLPLIGTAEPWQVAFMTVAIPGLLLVGIMQFVKEPPRQSTVSADFAKLRARESFAALFNYISSNRRLYIGLFFGLAIMASATFSLMNWTPVYFTRKFGWTAQQVGTVFGSIVLFSSPLAVFSGGFIATYFMGKGRHGANIYVPIAASLLAVIFTYLFCNAPNGQVATWLAVPAVFFSAMPFGCGTATLPLITPNRLRAQVVALYLLCANLLGLSLGPTAVGAITDYVYKDPTQIGKALGIVAPILFICGALILTYAIKPYCTIIRSQSANY